MHVGAFEVTILAVDEAVTGAAAGVPASGPSLSILSDCGKSGDSGRVAPLLCREASVDPAMAAEGALNDCIRRKKLARSPWVK